MQDHPSITPGDRAHDCDLIQGKSSRTMNVNGHVWGCVFAGVVLAAASKCETPNVKAVPPSHRVPIRPSTGEPKRPAAGQKAAKAEQPARLQRAASAEAAQHTTSAESGLADGRQAKVPSVALESAAAQVRNYSFANVCSFHTQAGCMQMHLGPCCSAANVSCSGTAADYGF